MNYKTMPSFKIFFFVFGLISLVALSSCSTGNNDSNNSKPNVTTEQQPETNNITYLKVISKYDGSYTGSNGNHGYIYRIGLAGYNFEDLKIEYNEAKTFELDGIPGGMDNVNVSVSFRPDATHYAHNNPASIKCNFKIGKTTTLTLTSGGSLQVSY